MARGELTRSTKSIMLSRTRTDLPASEVPPAIVPAVQFGQSAVVVQRDWNGWHTATVRLDDLEQVHWHRPGGAPRPLIHAYVECARLRPGAVPHDCAEDTAHRLLVCVLRQHTAPPVFEELARRADAAGN